MEAAGSARQFVEALLKCAVEMETEQDLRAENEQPRLVECGLDAPILRLTAHAAADTAVTASLKASSASRTACRRVASRPRLAILILKSRVALPRRQTARQTIPTGLSSSSGSGPATPVIAAVTLAADMRSAPSAMARATSGQTAVFSFSSDAGTPRAAVFCAFV